MRNFGHFLFFTPHNIEVRACYPLANRGLRKDRPWVSRVLSLARGSAFASLPQDDTCILLYRRMHQLKGADASGRCGRRHGRIDDMWMPSEPCWPETVLTYVGGRAVKRAPQSAILKHAVGRANYETALPAARQVPQSATYGHRTQNPHCRIIRRWSVDRTLVDYHPVLHFEPGDECAPCAIEEMADEVVIRKLVPERP